MKLKEKKNHCDTILELIDFEEKVNTLIKKITAKFSEVMEMFLMIWVKEMHMCQKKTVCLRFIHFTECKLNVNIVLLSLIKTCGYLACGCSSPFRLMCLHDTQQTKAIISSHTCLPSKIKKCYIYNKFPLGNCFYYLLKRNQHMG